MEIAPGEVSVPSDAVIDNEGAERDVGSTERAVV